MSKSLIVLAVLIWTMRAAPAAEPVMPQLHLPLACTPGLDCWITNHVDLDASSGVLDYACGKLTYDGHNGTDFAIRDRRAMRDGVAVLAAGAGIVRAIRDGEFDIDVRDRGLDAVKSRECGNGVRIEHDGGLQTQYCHLMRSSIAVRPGKRVEAGNVLGLVGLSGQTEYPHLHFTVRYQGRAVDPFFGLFPSSPCGGSMQTLWDSKTQNALPYRPRVILNYGIAGEIPQARAVREGQFRSREVSSHAEVLAAWVEAFGASGGDTLEIQVLAPDGSTLLHQRASIDRNQARIFRAVARKRGGQAWLAGSYAVRIALLPPGGGSDTASVVEFKAVVR